MVVLKRFSVLAFMAFGLYTYAQESALDDQLLPPTTQGDLMNNGLDEKARNEIVSNLNNLLANEYVLYTKTLKFHWNVVGPFFGSLHKLFNDQYEQLSDIVDSVAERIRSLGKPAFGTLQEFTSQATISENPGVNPDDMSMIRELLDGYEIVIKQIRPMIDLTAKLNDMGTNNFLADLIEKHEKTAWMLRAHLDKTV